MIPSADSYSDFERRFLAPVRRLFVVVLAPVIRVLVILHISPNVISFSQVILGGIVVVLIPNQPRLALVLFMIALVADGIDGALARATGQASQFGALFDQLCDHFREVMVVGGLALFATLNPLAAAMYGVTYPAFNLMLYLCNHYRDPLPIVIKSYMIVYPAIILYLRFGLDVLTAATVLSLVLMWIAIVAGLAKLRRVMPRA